MKWLPASWWSVGNKPRNWTYKTQLITTSRRFKCVIPRVARLINLSGRAEGPSGAKPREFERKNKNKKHYIYIYIYIYTRNTWLAKPREARAGWKALFTRIVASNEEIKRFLNIATILMSMVFSYFQRLVCGWNLFLTRRNVQRACSAVVFD